MDEFNRKDAKRPLRVRGTTCVYVPQVERWILWNLRVLRSGLWVTNLHGVPLVNRGLAVKRRLRQAHG